MTLYNIIMRMLYAHMRRRAHVHCTHIIMGVYYVTCASTAVQIQNDESQEAFEDSGYFSKISEVLVVWLSLKMLHSKVLA